MSRRRHQDGQFLGLCYGWAVMRFPRLAQIADEKLAPQRAFLDATAIRLIFRRRESRIELETFPPEAPRGILSEARSRDIRITLKITRLNKQHEEVRRVD